MSYGWYGFGRAGWAVGERKSLKRKYLVRRAMVSLCAALAGFVLLEAMTSLLADYIEPGLRDPEYGRKLAFLKSQLRESPERPLMLLLGSSRTAYGIRADAVFAPAGDHVPLAYNFGTLGGGPIYELLHFRRVLAEGIRPQWVVIEIHPGLLKVVPELMGAHQPSIDRCDARDLYAVHGYLDHPWTAWRDWLRYRAAGSYQLRAEIMRRVAPTWVPARTEPDLTALDKTTPFGWIPLPWPRPAQELRKQWAKLGCKSFAPSYADFVVSDRTNRALHEILSICGREQIGAALLLMPEAEELRDEVATSAQRQVVNYLTQLGQEYGVPLIDATHWCQDDEFVDGQHLLPEAAARLADRLGREALGDWVASTLPARGDSSGTTFVAGRPKDGTQR
jgi:hypothetical protein